jgi:glycosyltransferase involved in cell wall biosynthesis
MPGVVPSLADIVMDTKQTILWFHNTPTQFHVDAQRIYFQNNKFWEKIKYVVVPSQIAKDFLLRDLPNVDPDKVVVIPNAIIPAEYDADKFNNPGKVKLIHTSSAERSLPILMESLKYVEEDFRLDVYNDFNPDLHESLPIENRVMFHGKTPKAAVQEAFGKAHIFVYPSIFEETFCLSLAEAMSAGCLPVYSNVGAVAEISNKSGLIYEAPEDYDEHVKLFAEKLTEAIKLIKTGNWNPEEQVNLINKKYSWEAIKTHWLEFNALL